MPRSEGGVAALVVRHARWILVLFLAATALLAWQARHFSIDASPDTLLMKNNRNYIQSEIVSQRFSPQEFLLVAYRPRQHPVLSAHTFSDMQALTRELRQLPRVEVVRSILNVPLLTLMDTGLSQEIDPEQWTQAQRGFDTELLRKVFSDHPIYEDLLISKDQKTTALQVLFKPDRELQNIHRNMLDLQRPMLERELTAEESRTLEALRREAEPLQKRLDQLRRKEIEQIRAAISGYEDDADIYLGGVHVLGNQLINIIKTDLVVFGAAVAGAICLFLLVLFRRLRWVLLPALCCGVSVTSTIGLFALLGFKTTVISSSFIALQLILTLALVVHLIVQYRELCSDHPLWEQRALVEQTLRRKAAPCFYAGITTSVGFAALLASGIKPVISFGWMMVAAMFVSIGVSLALFPAVMALMRKEQVRAARRPAKYLLQGFRTLALRHPGKVLVVALAMTAVSALGIRELKVENSFIDYFRDATRVHRELSYVDQHFGGSVPLDIIYTIPESQRQQDLVLTAAAALTIKRMHHAVAEQEAVGKVLSPASFTTLAKYINDGKPLTEYELTAIYRTLDASLREDLVGSLFAPQHQQARISLRIKDSTPDLDRGKLLADIRGRLTELGVAEDRFILTNLFVLYQDVLERLFRSQILTLGIVFAALALTFLVIFRSFKLAVIGIVPNILVTLPLFGTMGWLGIPLDLMTITIASIAMGIAVDDTIHYIHRYRQELRDGDAVHAINRSHFSVGYAILYTSIIITAGFAMLMFSDFMPSVYFGLLTALTMAILVPVDLCVLPVLLRRFVGPAGAGA